MSNFASGRKSKAISDRSGMQFPYREMRKEWNGSLVHISEYEEKHPQLEPKTQKGDAQGLQNARPDRVEPPVPHILTNNAFRSGQRDTININVFDPGHGFKTGEVVRFTGAASKFPVYPEVSHLEAHDINVSAGHTITRVDHDNFTFNYNDTLDAFLTANCTPGVTTVYVDLDGTLTEYYQAVATYATSIGLLDAGGDWYGMNPTIEAAAVNAAPTTYFQNLGKRAEADALIDLVIAKNGSWEVLSTALDGTTQATQKDAWVTANFGVIGSGVGRAPAATNYSNNFDKGPFGGANKILIDDRTTYINQFEAAGGKGFKYYESGGILRFGGDRASVGPVTQLA